MSIFLPSRFFIQISLTVFFVFLLAGTQIAQAGLAEEIEIKNRQIQELQRQIEAFEREIESNRSKAGTLQGEINRLNGRISQVTLEIRSLSYSIEQTSLELKDTEFKITDTESKLMKHQGALAQYIRETYEIDRTSLTEVLLSNATLSGFFSTVDNLQTTQDNLRLTIKDIKELKGELSGQKNTLEDKQTDLERLKNLQELEKRSLNNNRSQKDKILKDTKGQESKYQELVKKSKRDIEAIRAQITYLQQAGISAEDAVKYAELAALRAEIRPAFLLALLEWETGLGRNVGKCNRAEDPPSKGYKEIMKPDRDIQPFLEITASLGLNPETTVVSCPQFVNGKRYGWGGAMGPAQFIPSTWMGYKDEIARLTGHNPANPWSIEDAFTASATKLARAGATAQTKAAEIAASKAYYSGNSKCSTAPCNTYANGIQRIATEIEQNL